jgi:hypothetical protein
VLKAAGLLPVMVFASSTLVATPMAAESSTLVVRGILRTSTASRPERLLGEVRSWDETKAARVRALRGKYRNALTPSDEFARQKTQEIFLEG